MTHRGRRRYVATVKIQLAYARSSLSLDLQVRDENDRVLHQVRDFEWSLQDIGQLQDVLLNLKIELESEDT